MAKFKGTWVDFGEKKGYDQFMDALGFGDAKDKWRNAQSTLKYDINGDKWTVTVSVSTYPGKDRTFEFEIGKELETKGFDGSDVKGTTTIISDSEIQEVQSSNRRDGKWRTYTVNRKISGDIMNVTISAGGASMTSQMKKQ